MSIEQNPVNSTTALRAGWNQPRPEKLPEPTAWPVALAFSITQILWGFVSAFFITGVGAALFIAAIAGWIGDIRHERKQH